MTRPPIAPPKQPQKMARNYTLRRKRPVVVVTLTVAAVIAIGLVALTLGDVVLSVPRVVAGLGYKADALANLLVEWRLTRVVGAIVIGAALALGGGLVQTVAHNGLASPDVIGFGAGSYTGALVVFLAGGAVVAADPVDVAIGSLLGGLGTGAAVVGLTILFRLDTERLVLVGIGVSAVLTAFNTFLLTAADRAAAQSAAIWGTGTLTPITWIGTGIVAGVVVLTALPIAILAPALRQLELGNETARSLGVRVGTVRLAAATIGVLLTALATAAAGPIAFIALAAPHIARNVSKTAFVPYWATAATGALLLLASDILAQHALPHTPVPTGVVTVLVGGAYLVFLLARLSSRTRAL